LSRDHLDYHDDMHAYAQAKAGLFAMLGHRQGLHATQLERATPEKPAHAVINADDTWAQTMIDACPRASRLWFYSVEDRPDQAIDLAARHNADLLWASYEPQDRGSGLRWARFAPEQRKATAQGVVQLGLMGRFNAANALAVACTLMALGQSTAQAMCSLALYRGACNASVLPKRRLLWSITLIRLMPSNKSCGLCVPWPISVVDVCTAYWVRVVIAIPANATTWLRLPSSLAIGFASQATIPATKTLRLFAKPYDKGLSGFAPRLPMTQRDCLLMWIADRPLSKSSLALMLATWC
jgi:hypothetical protein